MEQQAQAAWFSCQSQHSSLKLQSVQRRKKKSIIHLLSLSLAFLIFAVIISENFLKNFLVTLILMRVKTGSEL